MLSLLGVEIEKVEVSETDQRIRLEFGTGALEVSEDFDYEAWPLNGPRGEKIIATPGRGGLAIWGPREDA